MLFVAAFIAFVFSLFLAFFQTSSVDPSTVIVPVVGALAASALTGYLVGFFKMGFPTASSSMIVTAAILAGLATSILETAMVGGLAVNQVVIATVIAKGIGAAALAAGLTRTDQSGESARIKAGAKEPPPEA